MRTLGRILALASLGLMTSCGFGVLPAPEAPDLGPVPAYIRDAQPGESGEVDDVAFGGKVSVRVEEGYTSARGEECKRATAIAGSREAEVVVICKNGDGQWVMAPRVWGEGIAQPAAQPEK